MNVIDIVHVVNPKASQDDVEEIVWSRTPYPFGMPSAKSFYKEVTRFYRAKKNGIRLCDFCNNIAMTGDIVCNKCDNLLKNGALAER